MEYFTMGMKNFRVTQNYNGTTSHLKHWYKSRNYADYPIDIAGIDGGSEPFIAPVDMKITSIFGVGNVYTNTIWLETLEKVITPKGIFKVFIALTHFNDIDVKGYKVGDIIKKGKTIVFEGVDGANANHIHLVCGNAEKGSGNRLLQNSNKKYVSSGYCMKPEEIFFIDKDFTTTQWGGCIAWLDKPKVIYYPKTSYKGVSFVDGLKSIGIKYDFITRTKIANKNGIKKYLGLGSQNKQLLDLLKKGLLIA